MKSIIDAINLEKELHPQATSQDISKLIYQACFGNGHMITSVKDCLDQLKQEVVQDNSKPSIQNIGNGYVRVSCSAMKKRKNYIIYCLCIAQNKIQILSFIKVY